MAHPGKRKIDSARGCGGQIGAHLFQTVARFIAQDARKRKIDARCSMNIKQRGEPRPAQVARLVVRFEKRDGGFIGKFDHAGGIDQQHAFRR
ncbi:MAG: hypothetical protein ABGW90_07485, partial [Martelella sp.]